MREPMPPARFRADRRLIDQAKSRAEANGLSFSEYVRHALLRSLRDDAREAA